LHNAEWRRDFIHAAIIVVPRFGALDCRCPLHMFRTGDFGGGVEQNGGHGEKGQVAPGSLPDFASGRRVLLLGHFYHDCVQALQVVDEVLDSCSVFAFISALLSRSK
jgi:hypothetical protein